MADLTLPTETRSIDDQHHATAIARVFELPELLENILIKLAERDEHDQDPLQCAQAQKICQLFCLQQVNMTFLRTIANSKLLRCAMYLEQEDDTSQNAVTRFGYNPLLSWVVQTRYRATVRCTIRSFIHGPVPHSSLNFELNIVPNKRNRPDVAMAEALSSIPKNQQSWYETFARDIPVETWVYFKRLGLPAGRRQHMYSQKLILAGATLGDLVDKVDESLRGLREEIQRYWADKRE